MATQERLGQYYDFDSDILESVARVAASQNTLGFRDLADRFGMADGPQVAIPPGQKYPVEYVVFRPVADHDPREARILHTPMGNPVNESVIVRGARLFASDPTKQLIVIGNASDFRRPGTVPFRSAIDMIRRTDVAPAVQPSLILLQNMGIQVSEQLGYSFGADKAAAASAHASEYGIRATDGVFIEPAGVAQRGIFRLFQDFMRSGAKLEEYLRLADSKPLDQARSGYNTFTTARWFAGLARLSNVAIAHTLAHPTFKGNVEQALGVKDTSFGVTIGWGTSSELTPSEEACAITTDLRANFGGSRVFGMALRDMHHAGGDDIDLHAAIMLQGLRRPEANDQVPD